MKRSMIEKNLEKEKKKIEFKKLKILAKEKMNEERIQYMKFEEDNIKRSMAELTIQQQLEKERVMKTMKKVSSALDFKDQKIKAFIKDEIPDIDVSTIFKQKKAEIKENDMI